MFLCFLKSMQNKSQDAQNPGLWVNGNRMPMQEGVMGGIVKPLINAIAKRVTNKNAEFTNPDTGKALGDAYMSRWQERRDDEDKGINHENETPVDYTERKHEEEEDFVGPPSKLSGHNLYTKNQLVQEELARKLNPSSSSFFKPKSGRNNYLQLVAPPVDADGNREVTPEEAARSAALSAEIDASVKADKVRAQLQNQDKVVTDTRNPLEYAKDSTYDELDQRAAAIKRRRGQGLPVYSPDSAYEQDQNSAKAVVAGLQENTKRSMFLTHLQSMQTKSQDAQNPGLWVNGRRMPMHEMLTRGTPTLDQRFQSSARENEAAAKASFVNKANKIGAEGISPYLHQNNYSSEEQKQAKQNTQAYGSGKNLRWVDPSGVMHKGGDLVGNEVGNLDLQGYLDSGPVSREDLNRDQHQNTISPPKNERNFSQYRGRQSDSINGYNPWGSRNTDPSSGYYVGTEKQANYSILDNPDAAYGTDDPIARGIRSKNDQVYNNTMGDNNAPKGLQ